MSLDEFWTKPVGVMIPAFHGMGWRKARPTNEVRWLTSQPRGHKAPMLWYQSLGDPGQWVEELRYKMNQK